MSKRLPLDLYGPELSRLQSELVKLQEWMRSERARVVVVFEGRDAAGKGSAIKRVTEYLNPRVVRIAALPAPTERERTQFYFQRYLAHLPAAGEIVLSLHSRGHLLFSGVVRTEHFPPLSRVLFRAVGGRFGDFRDWEEIDRWTDDIAAALHGDRVTP